MRGHRAVALVATAWGCFAASAVQAAHATYRYVVVTTYNSGPYAPGGEPASLALEITDAPVAAAEGDVKKGEVIARHGLRAADAVVLDGEVKGAKRAIPAGTLLVKVNHGRNQAVWCDIRPTGRLLYADQYDCLEDPDGAGAFKRLWSGHTLVGFLGFGPSGVAAGAQLPGAVPYHRARPEARPTAMLGYRLCDGDGVSGPPRFALAITKLGETEGWPQVGTCMFGVWPTASDPSKVEVNGLHLTVATKADGGLHYRLADRLPAGGIADLSRSAPVRSLAPPRPAETTAGGPPIPPLPVPPVAARPEFLTRTGKATITQGVIRVGQTLLNVPVRHSLTGVLENRIKPGMMWRGDTAVEVGQPVFGIPTDDGKVVWCAPRLKPDPKVAGRQAYDTACFLPMSYGYQWIPHRMPALLPWNSLYSLSQTGSVSSEPSVKPGPISLPPMTLTYVLAEVKLPTKPEEVPVYRVDLMIDWGDGPQAFRRVNYAPTPGKGVFVLAGSRVMLQPAADPMELSVTVLTP